MRSIAIIFLFLFISFTGRSANNNHSGTANGGNNNDSSINVKSNIVLFKMMTNPSPVNSSNGSLRKAGKVARTSNSHSSAKGAFPTNEG